MNQLNVAFIYYLGKLFQPIYAVQKGIKPEAVARDIEHLILLMDGFMLPNQFELPLTIACLSKLRDEIKLWISCKHGFDLVRGYNPNSSHDRMINRIQERCKEFENIFFAELKEAHIYWINSVRAYSLDLLLNNGERALNKKLLPFIPEQCIKDFKDASKSLALGLSLATCFHLFRALESMLKQYGKSLGIINEELSDRDRNWGNYLTIIKGKGAKEGLINFLHQIKDTYRNPLIHSDATIDIDQAATLFTLIQGSIDLMAQLVWESNLSPQSYKGS